MNGNSYWGKILLVIVIVVSFVMSIVLSASSFTGYIVTEEVNSSFNLVSFGLFALGLICAFFYIRNFRVRRA